MHDLIVNIDHVNYDTTISDSIQRQEYWRMINGNDVNGIQSSMSCLIQYWIEQQWSRDEHDSSIHSDSQW
jgi:hypothetical protein